MSNVDLYTQMRHVGGLPITTATVISDKMDLRFVSFAAWNDMIHASFEKRFYVPTGTCTFAVLGIDRNATNHPCAAPAASTQIQTHKRTPPMAQSLIWCIGAVSIAIRSVPAIRRSTTSCGPTF